MHNRLAVSLAVLLVAAGCGGGSDDDRKDQPEEPPMKVEDTVFGDLVGTQNKARDRANAAVDTHREALESGIEAAEEATPPPEE